MATLQQNIMQAISDFDGIKNAIVNNGVGVPNGTDTSEYGNLINQACAAKYTAGAAIANNYPYLNTSLVEDYARFCLNGVNLAVLPYLDTSNATNCTGMFFSCNSITNFQKVFELGKCTTTTTMFYGCSSVKEIQLLHTNCVTNFSSMFYNCSMLETITGLDMSSAVSYSSMFVGCSSITNVILTGTLKIKDNNLNLTYSNSLTVESMMSFINAFENNTGGVTYTVKFGATNLAKLTMEQRAIAVNKNITLS